MLTDLIDGKDLNIAFRAMFEALPAAVYTTDAQGRLTYFNPAAVKLSGRVPELGTDAWCIPWKLFLPDGTPLPHDRCPMAMALKGIDVPRGIECIGERPDGSRFWFTSSPAVLRDDEGRVTGGINLLTDITDRKNAEIEANEQFRAIVETTPACVNIVAPDGTLLFMNPPGLAFIGASSPEAVIGNSFYDLVAPEHRERFQAFHQRVCGGEKGSIVFDMADREGARHHMETHSAPLRHVDGATVHLGVARDISARKQTEDAARLLAAIVDSSDDAIISKDLNGVITSWNNGAQRLFGYTAEETIGQSITILIPEDRLDEEPRILDRLRRGERVDHFETVRRKKDGTLLDISLTISPVKDDTGQVAGASKIARDITQQKRTEHALRESRENFRQLADSMPQMVWTARPEGSADYYNERWYEFTGFSRDGAVSESWDPLIHPSDLPSFQQSWAASVQTGSPSNLECRFWDRHENRWRWFVVRAVAVRSASGGIAKWFGTCTDIDEQKRVEDELRRANQDLEQFAYSASHDLQEPARSVKIFSELLAKDAGIDDDSREYLTYLMRGATRMEMLVRDLLKYTQVTKFEGPSAAADAGEALASTLGTLGVMIAETGAQIIAGPLPAVCVHAIHLHQLFQNLIGNAIKYRSPDRPPIIRITAERQQEHWLFSVADNGIGIEPRYTENIFGLFKRLHNDEKYSGTGIGLAICRRIVDRYHGRIWVESTPGEGSTFFFTLPV